MVISATEDTVRARRQKNNGGRSVVERTPGKVLLGR